MTGLLFFCMQGRLRGFLAARPNVFRFENNYVSLVNPSGKKALPVPLCRDVDQADTASDASCDVPPGFPAAPKPGAAMAYSRCMSCNGPLDWPPHGRPFLLAVSW